MKSFLCLAWPWTTPWTTPSTSTPRQLPLCPSPVTRPTWLLWGVRTGRGAPQMAHGWREGEGTVDGSEIPRPTTWDDAKTLVNDGKNYLYLNWCNIF